MNLPPLPETRAGRGARAAWLAALGWGLWWLLAFWLLAGHWETNPQYAYGWLVPVLALVLAWRRWTSRPAPEPSPAWAMPLVALAGLAVLPAWIIGQANPGWRLVPGALTLSAVAGTLGLAARLGGSRWARHFAFPILFTLTAVPWPSALEETLVQGLMRFVAGLTVAILGLLGCPAVQQGNLVEVATGVLGVDEACSGVRSLQAAFMAALAIGELFRLKTWARFALIGIAFVAALLANVARTTFLSLSAARDGIGAVAKWHDPAGYTVLTVCLIAIALCANFLYVRHGLAVPEASPAPVPALPAAAAAALTLWLVLIVSVGELWFNPPSGGRLDSWTIQPPFGAKTQTLPEASLALLGCDRTRAGSWHDRAGAEWTLFFLEWFPSRSRTALLARTHRPEVCLPGSGYSETAEPRTLDISAGGHDLKFQSLQFRDARGRDLFVFYCAWEMSPGHPGRNVAFNDDTRTTSLLRVWQRERILSQQVAELFVLGAASREAAEASLRAQIADLVTVRPQ